MGRLTSPQPDPPPTEVPGPVIEEPADPFDDMKDSSRDLDNFSLLPLQDCQKITEVFRKLDESAISYQDHHRWLTRLAAIFGTAGVALAILELGSTELAKVAMLAPIIPPSHWLSRGELFCVFVAVVAASWGMIRAYKERWLLQRHQAEWCRLLKYEYLIHPPLWERPQWIDEQLQSIRVPDIKATASKTVKRALHQATREAVPHGPFEITERPLSPAVVRSLIEYYLARRLSPQKEYLANRMVKNERGDRIEWVIFLLFVGSVGVVLLRSTAGLVLPDGSWSVPFTLLAALLPAAAAGFRLLRSSGEFSRNKARFEAAHLALGDLERRVNHDGLAEPASGEDGYASSLQIVVSEAETPMVSLSSISIRNEPSGAADHGGSDDTTTNARLVLRDLCWCEHILKSEHMEWLRLMYETEWFG
jgi:hypothetical protein